jgi:hypothetical protein
MKKKLWTTPELIVLVRSNPEEAVLRGCKRNAGGVKGPPTINKCDQANNGGCSALRAS